MSAARQGEGRMIIEMGMGNSLHGRDYTKAALRAIDDAMRHSSLAILGLEGSARHEMRVCATIGVQKPDAIDVQAISGHLGGAAEVVAELGGLDVVDAETGEVHVIAAAAVEVFLPLQTGWKLRAEG